MRLALRRRARTRDLPGCRAVSLKPGHQDFFWNLTNWKMNRATTMMRGNVATTTTPPTGPRPPASAPALEASRASDTQPTLLRRSQARRLPLAAASLSLITSVILLVIVRTLLSPSESLWGVLMGWDASWYRDIALHGYSWNPHSAAAQNPAFFPLPLLFERAGHALTGLSIDSIAYRLERTVPGGCGRRPRVDRPRAGGNGATGIAVGDAVPREPTGRLRHHGGRQRCSMHCASLPYCLRSAADHGSRRSPSGWPAG